jgi:hypothetical protein
MDENADKDADSGTASTTDLTTEGAPGSVEVGQTNTDVISGVTDTSGVTSTGVPPLALPAQRLVTSLPYQRPHLAHIPLVQLKT